MPEEDSAPPTGTPPAGGIPRVRVTGTPYERGRQYGAQARNRIRLSVQAYQRVFAHYAGWDWPDGTTRKPSASMRSGVRTDTYWLKIRNIGKVGPASAQPLAAPSSGKHEHFERSSW